jgi:hypothetical protein
MEREGRQTFGSGRAPTGLFNSDFGADVVGATWNNAQLYVQGKCLWDYYCVGVLVECGSPIAWFSTGLWVVWCHFPRDSVQVGAWEASRLPTLEEGSWRHSAYNRRRKRGEGGSI